MGLVVFKGQMALLKREFRVNRVPWAALLQLFAIVGAQDRGKSCWVV